MCCRLHQLLGSSLVRAQQNDSLLREPCEQARLCTVTLLQTIAVRSQVSMPVMPGMSHATHYVRSVGECLGV